ncbi:glycoside hydrolase family 31 protein [Athelia psychrophila]|uniref:Glycoside hydrolase family 31 protein n=1 Tax=Athelia psychrophila TaxID=1759441 RepID=A0A167XP61_9AGAM|nr:glycoside hydrolase family 31 protein [Fibularhizoctonia sp. CBS 109695]
MGLASADTECSSEPQQPSSDQHYPIHKPAHNLPQPEGPGLAIVPVTNPAANEWYHGKLESVPLDLGVDCFKVQGAPASGDISALGRIRAAFLPLQNYGEEAAVTMAKFVNAKHRLMPYIFNLSIQAHTTGHPLQRAMLLEFLGDRTTHHLDRQYMLGPSLLVAPIFAPTSKESKYYAPAGRWTSFFHPARTLEGPAWVTELVPIDELPVWVRPHTVLCLGPAGVGRPDYALHRGVDVRLYALEEGRAVETRVPSEKGDEIVGTVRAKLSGGGGGGDTLDRRPAPTPLY